MSNDFPLDPREALEASLTALLLGELPADQAAFLREAIARDPELARQYQRLKQAVELVQTTTKTPAGQTPPPAQALKLSPRRRDELLTHFRTVTPKQFREKARKESSWLIPTSIAAVFIAICGVFLLPALSKSKSRHMLSTHMAQQDVDSSRLHSLRGEPRGDRHKSLDVRPTSAKAPQRAPTIGSNDSIASAIEGLPKTPTLLSFSETNALNYRSSTAPGGEWFKTSGRLLASSASGGGGLGGGATSGAAPPPHRIPEQIAAFRRSYEPEAGKPVTAATESETAAKNEIPPAVDPVTGLPVQIGGVATPTTEALSREEEQVAAKSTDSVAPSLYLGMDSARKGQIEDSKDTQWDLTTARPLGFSADGRNISNVSGVAELPAGDYQAFTFYRLLEPSKQDDSKLKEQPAPTPLDLGLNKVPVQGLGDMPHMLASGETLRGVELLRDETRRELARTEEQLVSNLGKKEAEKSIGAVPGLQAKADSLKQGLAELDKEIKAAKDQDGRKLQETHLAQLESKRTSRAFDNDSPLPKQQTTAPVTQPEMLTHENAFSTFSLNVSDVSFKLATASLEKGSMPEPASIRVEEFINAFDYRDPEPGPSVPIGFTGERSQYPFAQNRDLLRFSLKTAAQGRQAGRPLNLVLLLDNSGSMERADRVRIIQEALRVLAAQLQPQDTFSVVTFARTARLWVDGIAGNQAGKVAEELGGLTPQGGTNLEEAMNLAYQTALRHYLSNGVNRVVLLTDGAANLGNVDPEALKQKVETNRKQGIALDCFGIGWEGYNDDLLEALTRNGDGRYGFINTPEEATSGFANQLAGALQVAASDVKVQVEFNANRVTSYRQIGYARHQLTKEQFRDNTVDAAELGAAESGNALYVVQVNPDGEGPIATVRVRYKVPGTTEFHEHEWPVPYTGKASPLPQASPALRLAASASAFGEWLSQSPYATEVTPDALLGYLNGIPEIYGADARPKTLEWMIRQVKSLSGK